jgi:hypothetical protein
MGACTLYVLVIIYEVYLIVINIVPYLDHPLAIPKDNAMNLIHHASLLFCLMGHG